MGRPLRPYACDNCIPGDASGWTLPLLALVLLCGAGAAALWFRANDATGPRRAPLLRLSGLLLLAGPPVAVAGLMGDVTRDRVHCGSALSASMLRGRPDDSALDDGQRGCLDRGELVVRVAVAWGAGTSVLAAVAGVAGAVPARRRPVLAA